MAYGMAVLKQLEAYTAKHLSRMGGFSTHIRLTDYVTWLKKDLLDVLYSYGIAPPPENWRAKENTPYLPGFEKYFSKAIG